MPATIKPCRHTENDRYEPADNTPSGRRFKYAADTSAVKTRTKAVLPEKAEQQAAKMRFDKNG